MSAAEVLAPAGRTGLGGRLLASELTLILRRRRNQLLLVALAAIPLAIGLATRFAGSAGSRDSVLSGLTNNGVVVGFGTLVAVLPIFLPLVVSVVAGDSVAGEANLGTLRYLLIVPVSRTRLLASKFAALVAWCVLMTAVPALIGLLIGVILFPNAQITVLSGNQIGLADGSARLLVAIGYGALMMIGFAALALFISTLTEVPIAAMATALTLAVVMQVLDLVSALHAIHPWLISHYFFNISDLLRAPVDFSRLQHGALVALGYVLVFWTAAWARLSTKDISS
ncbi:MAG: transporter permease [Frankiales bacterium]|jgi:ABC-2 type transport system permease protein|nr:transporter permease [Frankiales bacterium]